MYIMVIFLLGQNAIKNMLTFLEIHGVGMRVKHQCLYRKRNRQFLRGRIMEGMVCLILKLNLWR